MPSVEVDQEVASLALEIHQGDLSRQLRRALALWDEDPEAALLLYPEFTEHFKLHAAGE